MLSDFQYCIQLMLKNQVNIKTHPKKFNDKYHDVHCTREGWWYIGIKGDGGVKSTGTRLLIEKEK